MKLVKLLGPATMLLITLLLCEAILRIVPSPIAYRPIHEFGDPNSLLGIELSPSTTHHISAPCYESTITTNSHGWRDSERTIERATDKLRIAVLGDSFMEGLHVNDDQTFAKQLEKALGPDKAEVLNFGISTIGTVQEEILYEKVVQEYNPDIILLAMYRNDIINNHPALDGAGGVSRLTYRNDEGELIHERTAGNFFHVRKWLRQHSATFRLLKFAYSTLNRAAPSDLQVAPSLPPEFTVYTEPAGVWNDAWKETEKALVRLQQDTTGKQLYVFWIPDTVEVATDPAALIREQLKVEPPTGFNVNLPNDKLEIIAASHGINTINLRSAFLAYRDAHSLEYPYFARTCENHWSPLGHSVAADAVAEVLRPAL